MSLFDSKAFDDEAHTLGFDQVLDRDWAPLAKVGLHSHPFDARAVVTRGEMWLTVDGATRHLRPGDRFELARDTPHSERYGPEGATYRAARRSA